jgi:hypothetical protein
MIRPTVQVRTNFTQLNRLIATVKGKHVRIVTDGVPYGIYQEFGTKGGYPIYPKNKKALWWQGLAHPIPMVKDHPGVPPRPFMTPAAEAVRNNLKSGWKQFKNWSRPKQYINELAEKAQRVAKRRAPFKTGALKDSIEVETPAQFAKRRRVP